MTPSRVQAIAWIGDNCYVLLMGFHGQILAKCLSFSLQKIHLKAVSVKCRPLCSALWSNQNGSIFR